MKKVLFCSIVLMSIISGCIKHDFERINYQEVKEETFASNFNDAFETNQEIYKNHKWGMDKVPLIVEKASTRGAYPNGNQWESDGYVVPADITKEELDAVLAVFNQKGEEEYVSLVDWNNFFVQQVYKGTKHYTAGNGGDVIGSDHMDWLCTVANQKVEVICWWPYEEKVISCPPYDDHIFNFNGSSGNDYGGIMLMLNSNTNKFGYHNSEDSKVHYNFRMEKINGNYYVGFDFYGNGQNPNQQIERDYIYNDWIVKIVPGDGVSNSVERVRIMCEDLGASRSDFDYNDVVFDIKFIKKGNTYTADIILQAAGGELPLYIGGREVHSDLFKVGKKGGNLYPIINTGEKADINGKEPVHFTVENITGDFENAWDAINALPVVVMTDGGSNVMHLTINPGSPAEMIAVPVTTDWSEELVSIKDTYPSFVDWIKDQSITWWE